MDGDEADDPLDDETFEELRRRGTLAWNEFSGRRGGAFHRFIPADYDLARRHLGSLLSRSNSFIELGSGVGVITILADLLGFDAHGIEIEPELVDTSLGLAEDFSSRAIFVEGSFVPQAYRDEIELLSGDFHTVTEGADAYEEMGLELADFDLIYAYPWPGEEDWIHELVRRHASPSALFTTYSSDEGFLMVEL